MKCFINIERYFLGYFYIMQQINKRKLQTYESSEIQVRMVIPVSGQRVLKHLNKN